MIIGLGEDNFVIACQIALLEALEGVPVARNGIRTACYIPCQMKMRHPIGDWILDYYRSEDLTWTEFVAYFKRLYIGIIKIKVP